MQQIDRHSILWIVGKDYCADKPHIRISRALFLAFSLGPSAVREWCTSSSEIGLETPIDQHIWGAVIAFDVAWRFEVHQARM